MKSSLDKLIDEIQTLEFIYGWLNLSENKTQLLQDKADDDILYLFYEMAIDLYLQSLTSTEKEKRGMKTDG